ncbi:MAG: flagellar biosynthetic protein FliR [Syntrophomonadaceae bacterium]|nr:flagellar biosynthetic protein FliR [Syntrophomonadaceae bacterium]
MPGWESLPWGFLVLARIASFMSLAPFFSIKHTPNLLKVGLAVFVTLLLLPTLPTMADIPMDLISYAILIIKEVVVGLILGYTAVLTFTAIRIGGELIDSQMGFAMAAIVDPQNNTSITLVAEFMYMLQILLFLAVDGHHRLLMAISYSYTLIPVAGAVFKTTFVTAVLQMFIEMFSLGIRMAAPFIVAFLVCDIALGIMARTVPQLNVFLLSFPLKTGLGMLTIIAVLPVMTALVNIVINLMEKDLILIMDMIK